jgi:hypothetical protein
MQMEALNSDKFRVRKVVDGAIVYGRTIYRPLPGPEPYCAQLDGKWCRFGRALGWGGKPTGFLVLCEVRDDAGESYLVTPEVEKFRAWYPVEEDY